MSTLQSVPFLPSGDLSKISWVDDLLHSWHRGVNDHHYNFVLCSAGWESKLNCGDCVILAEWRTICPHNHIQYSSLNPAKISHPSEYFISITIYLQKTFIRSSVSFWGKLFRICKVAIFPLILSSHLTESFINPLISQVLRGSKYNERKMVFYMTYPGAGDARVVPTYVPFPSRE